MQLAALTFVLLTSLIGTFVIIKTLVELFFADKSANITKILISDGDQAEYLIRTALIRTNDIIKVIYNGDDPEIIAIIGCLSRENPRVHS